MSDQEASVAERGTQMTVTVMCGFGGRTVRRVAGTLVNSNSGRLRRLGKERMGQNQLCHAECFVEAVNQRATVSVYL
jgi:hypothetical protein